MRVRSIKLLVSKIANKDCERIEESDKKINKSCERVEKDCERIEENCERVF